MLIQQTSENGATFLLLALKSTTVHKHKMIITHPGSLSYGHHGAERRGGILCETKIYIYIYNLFFMWVLRGGKCMSRKSWMVLAMGLLCFYASMCVQVCSLSIGVRTALLGHDDPLPHQNYHCRPLSWLRFLNLDFCQNLLGQLPRHLLQ